MFKPLKKLRQQLKNRRILSAPIYRKYPPRISPIICDSRCAISLPHRFVYFRIPKAANSTVTASLHFLQSGEKPSNWREMDRAKKSYTTPSRLSCRHAEDTFKNFFTFTVVRDPFSRLISGYLDKIVGGEGPYRATVAHFLHQPLESEISLSEFVSFLEHGDNRNSDPHWCQQTDLIFLPVDELDFIGRFENLDHDLSHILEQIFPGRRQSVNWIPHATNASERVTSLIDEALSARIARLYQDDFNRLGYSTTPG